MLSAICGFMASSFARALHMMVCNFVTIPDDENLINLLSPLMTSTMVHLISNLEDSMQKLRILTLIGGISRKSLNQMLFSAIESSSHDDLYLETFDISTLPYFSQDLELDLPFSVRDFKEKIRESDAVLFVTPEYNHSIPGVLKNAIDWGSRPYGQNVWNKKPAAIMGASISVMGTINAQNHLRQILAYLNMRVMTQPEFLYHSTNSLDRDGNMNDDKGRLHLEKFLNSFVEWVDYMGEKNLPALGLQDSAHLHFSLS